MIPYVRATSSPSLLRRLCLRRLRLVVRKPSKPLIRPRRRHHHVHRHQVVVHGRDVQRVLAPDQSRERHRALLRDAEQFGRAREILHVRRGDPPFHRRRPEEDGFRARGVVPE